MKSYNYFNVIFAMLVLNFAFAELRTFPEDTQKVDSPTETVNPEENTPEEGTPEEGGDMPTTVDDSEISEDLEPTFKEEYVLSLDLSLPIYTGSNLESRFDNGLSFGFEASTPFGFEVVGQDINVSAQLLLNSFTANENSTANGTSDYTPILIGAKLNSKVSVLDVSLCTGLAIASGDSKTGEEYSMTTLYAGAGLGYSLGFESLSFMPESMKGMSMKLGADLRMIFGSPDDQGNTSNLVNVGMSISYPLYF